MASATTGGQVTPQNSQWSQIVQYAIPGGAGSGDSLNPAASSAVTIPGIGTGVFAYDASGNPTGFSVLDSSGSTFTAYTPSGVQQNVPVTSGPSFLSGLAQGIVGVAPYAAAIAAPALISEALGADVAGAGLDQVAGADLGTTAADASSVLPASGVSTGSTFDSLVNSTGGVNPLPADSIQSSIDSISGTNAAGTGINDIANVGSQTLPGSPLAGATATGIPVLDQYASNAGVNLANSAAPLTAGLGSVAADSALGGAPGTSLAPGIGTLGTAAALGSAASGTGTGTGTSTGGSSLGSLAGISALIPGLAMIGSVASGQGTPSAEADLSGIAQTLGTNAQNTAQDTSALSSLANQLTTAAGNTTPDTSAQSALAGQLSGPGSLESLLTSQANSLIPSVSTGNLPPGAQTLINNALNDATNSIKSKYAQLGLTGSTMEAQELASAQSQAQAQAFNYATQLTNTGLTEANAATGDITSAAGIQGNIVSEQQAGQAQSAADLAQAANVQNSIIQAGFTAAGLTQTDLADSAALYNDILTQQVAQDTALQQALANFASASAIGIGLAASGNSGANANSANGLISSLSSLGTGIGNLVSSAGSGLSNLISSATS